MKHARASRALAFLSDKYTRFRLLLTLTMAVLLKPLTTVLFLVSNSDRPKATTEQINYQRRAENKRRRMRSKGPEAASDPDRCSIHDVGTAIKNVIARLWSSLLDPTGGAFQVAAAFWPADCAQADLHVEVTTTALTTIAHLKWRMANKFAVPPHSLSALDFDMPPEEEQQLTDGFCNVMDCCLDPFWGQPAQQDVKSNSNSCKKLRSHYKDWDNNIRHTSLREEGWHAFQRQAAGGHSGRAKPFVQQSAEVIVKQCGKQ
jgi:hypothetical protein